MSHIPGAESLDAKGLQRPMVLRGERVGLKKAVVPAHPYLEDRSPTWNLSGRLCPPAGLVKPGFNKA